MTEPTLTRKSVARVAKKLCELGATTEDLAEAFGVSKDEMERWLRSYGDFSRACANGRIAAINNISNMLRKRATGMNLPYRRIVRLDGMAAQITVEETRPPDLTAANAILGDFRQRDEVKLHRVDSNPISEAAMAALLGTITRK